MLAGPKERVFAYNNLISNLNNSCFIQNHNDFLRQQDSWPFYDAHNFTNKFLMQPIFRGRPVLGFREPWRRRMWKRISRHFYKVFSPLGHKIPLFWLPQVICSNLELKTAFLGLK